MISRRLLRIKALMAFYAFNCREDDNLPQAESELMFSVDKTYDLYHLLLMLIVELADIANDKIDQALQKLIPTPEDLNPKRKFVDNLIVEQLRNNRLLNNYINSKKISWANNSHIPRLLYNKMLQWDAYEQYINSETNDYQTDKKFIIKLVTEFFALSEDLSFNLEEQSIYWNDDMEYIVAMVEKTLGKFSANPKNENKLMPLFKNDDDAKFVKTLFAKAILDYEKSSELIDRNTTNWEIERIALMDILVMRLAITEIIEFPEIPVKVTLNEYIEISKYYCTSKSSTFVNGILDKIVKEMRDKALFEKFGRGLIGEEDSEL
jgi:N utilization substance protein B